MQVLEFAKDSGVAIGICVTVDSLERFLVEMRQVKATVLVWYSKNSNRCERVSLTVSSQRDTIDTIDSIIVQIYEDESDLSVLLKSVEFEVVLMNTAGSVVKQYCKDITKPLKQNSKSVDVQSLRTLQRLTNSGLSDCKRALTESQGDLFLAATSMLSESKIKEIAQSVRVRAMAGTSIKDPVEPAERQFVEDLLAYCIAKRTRSMNVGFQFGLAKLFLTDANVQAAIREDCTVVKKFADLLNAKSEFGELQNVEMVVIGKLASTIIAMPQSQSEYECDFIVLQHPEKSLFRSKPSRVFVVYKRTKRSDRGIANVAEWRLAAGEIQVSANWVNTDLEFDAKSLAMVHQHARL